MKALSDLDAQRWCETRLLTFSKVASGFSYLRFPDVNYCVVVEIPERAMRSVALSHLLLTYSVKDQEESNFEGGLLWLRDWNIGSPELERAGHRVLECLRACSGEVGLLADLPAQVLERHEFLEAGAAIVQVMVYGWDAYYVPVDAQFFLFVSNDDLLYLVSRSRLVVQHAAERLTRGGWTQRTCDWPEFAQAELK